MIDNPWLHGLVVGGGFVGFAMGVAAMWVWGERRFSALMQNRRGPVWVGPQGLLQVVADALKMIQKEDIIPRYADHGLFNLAPLFPLFLALSLAAVVPFAATTVDGSWVAAWAPAPLDIGVLWFLSLGALQIFPIWMAGWASNNKYSLLSGMRMVAQGISYEIPIVLTAMVPVVLAGSLDLSDIVTWQAEHGWFVAWPPGPGLLAFLIFFAASLAEADRIPFDIPEAESELVAGVYVEYTGIKMGLFVLAEYVHTLVAAALAAALFLGGAHGPGPAWLGLLWMLAKTMALFVLIYWIRWSWLRYRADQLMALAWKWLLPMALVLVMLSAVWVYLVEAA